VIVVDASALVDAVAIDDDAAARLRRRLAGEVCHAPHLIDAELGNVLRRLVLRGAITTEHGATALAAAPVLVDERHGLGGALARIAWSLRENLSFYDALYVALAARLEATLVTGDARLARAPGLPCRVELSSAPG